MMSTTKNILIQRANLIVLVLVLIQINLGVGQSLPPKAASPINVKQIHSGHSLTDPLFGSTWPGLYVNLIGHINDIPSWQLFDVMVGKSTGPGSTIRYRWENPTNVYMGMNTGGPDARLDIDDWELLSITERVPLFYTGGSTQQWYLDGIQEQKQYLSSFVNNAWNNGNNGNGAPTLLWTTWVHVDNSSGPFRASLDIQGSEWEAMQDYANANKPSAAPPVYLIPGHKMMAMLYDDIQLNNNTVPGITNINQFFSDNIHVNDLGAYAIAMIHYACIFNTSPIGLPRDLLPSGSTIPSQALATYLQNMVWEVVTSYPRTGIKDNTTAISSYPTEDICIYPNPTTHFINVCPSSHLKPFQNIKIYNSLGYLVLETTDNSIDISTLPDGIYILRMGDSIQKIIKH